MRALWSLPLALVLVVSGCLSTGTPANLAPPAVPDLLTPLDFDGCELHLGVVAESMAEASAGLPEGLTPIAFDDAGQTAAVLVAGHRCNVSSGDRVVPELTEFGAFLLVEPSADLARADADTHAVYYGMITPDLDNAAAFTELGIPTFIGNVTLEDYAFAGAVPLVTPAGRWVHTFGGDGNFSAHLDLLLPGAPAAGTEGGLMRFFVVDFEAGELVSVLDLDRRASDYTVGAGVANFRVEAPLGPTGDVLGFVPQSAYSGVGLVEGGDAYGWTITQIALDSLGASAPADGSAARGPTAFGVPLVALRAL